MDLRVINEVGYHDAILALEPSRRCVGKCTFCVPALNVRARQVAGKAVSFEVPQTFVRYINRAFGPDYDPTDLVQWGLANRLPLTWASGVEPWQDVEQARGVLDIADRLDLPLFVQTRATNWKDVWPQIKARAGQLALYVSMPSRDPAVVKRFEPGTPPPAEREAIIRAAADAGITTILALAPYHPDWCDDLGSFAREAIESWGVAAIFADPLHLNNDQLKAASDREALKPLVATAWSDRTASELAAARDACIAHCRAWFCPAWQAPVHRLESTAPTDWLAYRNAARSGYHDFNIFGPVERLIADEDAPPLLVTWEVALAAMERHGVISQRFSWRSLGERIIGGFRNTKTPPDHWLARLRAGGTLADYLHAKWDTPRAGGFFWRHPFVRLASRPDGEPWRTADGSPLAIFDVATGSRKFERVVDDPTVLDFMTFDGDGAEFVRARKDNSS